MIRRWEGNSCDSGFPVRAFMLRSFAKSSRILQRRPESAGGTGHDHSRREDFLTAYVAGRASPMQSGSSSRSMFARGLANRTGRCIWPGSTAGPPRPPSCLSTRDVWRRLFRGRGHRSGVSPARSPLGASGPSSPRRKSRRGRRFRLQRRGISINQPPRNLERAGMRLLFLRAIWTAVA